MIGFLLKLSWWKWLCIALMLYTVVAGFLMPVPAKPLIYESIRNLYYHVTMWMAMMVMLMVSFVQSLRYLLKANPNADIVAAETANMGTIFGVLGLATGMIWATFTWGEPWSGDPKQNAAAVGVLLYFAYMILRGSIKDDMQRARVSAVYNVFAFVIFFPLIYILPKMSAESLHPGAADNPTFAQYDLASTMKAVFYPAIIGWSLLGWWLSTLRIRSRQIVARMTTL
jgi:heme exporter protein C